jgi:hypothetical protein
MRTSIIAALHFVQASTSGNSVGFRRAFAIRAAFFMTAYFALRERSTKRSWRLRRRCCRRCQRAKRHDTLPSLVLSANHFGTRCALRTLISGSGCTSRVKYEAVLPLMSEIHWRHLLRKKSTPPRFWCQSIPGIRKSVNRNPVFQAR